MAHPYDARGTNTGTLLRGVLVALVAALLLLLGAPTQEAEAQSTTPTVERVSPPEYDVSLSVGDTQKFTARATASDDDIDYWAFFVGGRALDGGVVEPTQLTEQSFPHTFSEAGVYSIRAFFLEVNREDDASIYWEVTVTNSAPTISAHAISTSPDGAFILQAGDTLSLSAVASDEDANITSASWFFDGEDTEKDDEFDNLDEAVSAFTHTYSEAGEHEISVKFSDSEMESVTHSWTIRVQEKVPVNNGPPSAASVSPTKHLSLDIGQSQTFTASATDPDNNISQVEWLIDGQVVEGTPLDLTGSTENSYPHEFSDSGYFRIEARFGDNGGLSATVLFEVSVGNWPVIDSLGCLPQSPSVGESIICQPVLSGGTPTGYVWGAAEGLESVASGSDPTFSVHFDTPGEKSIVFGVVTEIGSDDDGVTIFVTSRSVSPPIIDNLNCSPPDPGVDDMVTCTPGLSGGAVSTYEWSSPVGNPSSGSDTTFTTSWSSIGDKQVSLEACNDDGCDTSEQTITVLEAEVTSPITTTQPPGDTTGGPPTVTTTTTQPAGGTTGGTPTTTISVPPQVTALSLQTPAELRELEVGSTFGVTARATDANADIVSLRWYVSGEPSTYLNEVQFDPSSSVESTLAFRIHQADDYHIRVDFVDSESGIGTTEWSFTADDRAPKVDAITCRPYSPEVGDVVHCTPRLSGGTPVERFWLTFDPTQHSSSGEDFKVTWRTPGEKQVTLGVCNQSLHCHYYSEWIQVLPTTSPPQILSVGCDQEIVHVGENLHCSPQISGGPPVEYSWAAQYGFPSTGNGETFAPDWHTRGENTVTLKVCTSIGECDTRSQKITVGHPIPPPVIESLGCRPLTVDIDEEVECEARLAETGHEAFYDRSEDDVYYSWSLSSDNDATYEWENQDLSVRWHEGGSEKISLRVCNIEDECDNERQTITVETNRGSSLRINTLGCSTGTVNVNRDVTCNPDVSADRRVNYYWSTLTGSPSSARTRGLQTQWNSEGSRLITLKVCDGRDCVEAEHQVEVIEPVTVNRPPVATRISPGSPVTVIVGQNYTFVANATDPDGDLRSYGWQVSQRSTPATLPLNSGSSPTQTHNHVFDSPGHYLVSIAFYDSAGQSSRVVWEVTAVENPSIPLADLQGVNDSLLALQGIKRQWLACVGENPDNETLCLSELESISSARVVSADLASIFDRYEEYGFGEDFIRDVETILIVGGYAQGERRKAAILILQGALCGQACLELEVAGSESPWYLVGWLLAGFVPVVDIVTDGRDVIVSGVGCVAGLISLDGCDWVDLGVNGLGLATSFVPVGVAQVGNVPQAGLHIVKYASRVPRATAGILRACAKIPLLGKQVDKGVVWAVNRIFTENTANRTEFLGAFLGKKGSLYPWVRFDFHMGAKDHILNTHYPDGGDIEGKGLFDRSTSIDSLVSEANLVVPRFQDAAEQFPSQRLQWIVDAGEPIGKAKAGQGAGSHSTSVYTVITELDGTVVTAHPGIPKFPTKIGPKYDPTTPVPGNN